jgi:hypothetical protein
VRATGSVISWMGKGVMMPTASSASAVSGRIPRSRKVVVRAVPLLCTRCEASVGVVSGPDRKHRPPHGRAEWHGTTADARALVPLRVPPNSVRIVPYG